MESIGMKTLLWKEYRQTRRLLVGVGICVLIPYLVVSVLLLGVKLIRADAPRSAWGDAGAFAAAGIWGTIASTFMAAFIGGNALAGERADRSAEFAAYLPIKRQSAVISKAMLAISVSLLLCLFNVAMYYAATLGIGGKHSHEEAEVFLIAGTTAVMLFGLSWLFSSFAGSAVFATAAGIGVAMILPVTLAALDVARSPVTGLGYKSVFNCYPPLSLTIGVTAFVAGIICYLRRVEP
jgi:ABC-type transport system involved in multi-copper enzyme maturation permease subunit